MVPAQKGFAAANLVAFKVDDRLVVQLQLALHEHVSEINFQGATRLHARIHLRFEIAIGAPALGLGPVQSHIRAFQQPICIGTVVGRQSNAYANIHHNLVTIQFERCPDHLIAKALRKHRSIGQLLQWGLHNCKLVATQPRNKICVS